MAMTRAGSDPGSSLVYTTRVVTRSLTLADALREVIIGELSGLEFYCQAGTDIQHELDRLAQNRAHRQFDALTMSQIKAIAQEFETNIKTGKYDRPSPRTVLELLNEVKKSQLSAEDAFSMLPGELQGIVEKISTETFSGPFRSVTQDRQRQILLMLLEMADEADTAERPPASRASATGTSATAARSPPPVQQARTPMLRPHPATSANAMTAAREALSRGDPIEASRVLDGAAPSPGLRNVRAVCALRQGRIAEALAFVEPAVLPGGIAEPDDMTPDAWIITLATARAMNGDYRGAKRALEWVKDQRRPGAVHLGSALAAAHRSLPFWKRLTGAATVRLVLDYPPGEI